MLASTRQETSLGECGAVVNRTVSPDELGDTPYIGLEHIGENTLSLLSSGLASDVTSAKSRFERDDVLFGKLRPYFRKVVRAPFDGICSTDIWVVKPKSGVDAMYLFYLMASQDFVDFATQGSIGTKMPRAKWDHVSSFPVFLPPLPEQRRIAHILGTLDDKIELNRRMNKTLEEMARAIFKDWFVDFGPVRAKIAGRDAYLPDKIWRLFPDRLVESELGEVPEGWGVRSLEKVLLAVNDRVGDTDVPEFSCTNTGLHPREDRFKKRLSKSKSNNKLIRDGDLVFGLSRQILNFGLMRDEVGCVSPAYKVFRVDRDIIRPDLLERIMRLKIDYYYGAVSASSREGQSISVKALEGLSVVCPPKEVQLGFYRFTDNFGEQTVRLGNSIAALSGLRDSLLPGLVSGEINSNTKAKGDAHIDN